MTYLTSLSTPLGRVLLASGGEALTGAEAVTALWFEGQKYFAAGLEPETAERPDLPVFRRTEEWLRAYFAGRSLPPLPPLAPRGSPFRQAVWKLLLEIPSGETATYGALSERLKASGIPASPQAVGGAVGHNPISILIPCHRVVGADGSLTGYAGGLEKKRFLLELEGADLSLLYTPKAYQAL